MRRCGRQAWLAAAVLLAGCGSGLQPAARDQAAPKLRNASYTVPAGPADVHSDVAAFYKDRNFRPLWLKGRKLGPEALLLLDRLRSASHDGFDPKRYRVSELLAAAEAGRSGNVSALARTDLLLSAAFVDYVRDLGRPADGVDMFYVDRELKPSPPDRRSLLDAAASAPSLRAHLIEALRMNPVYEALRHAGSGLGAAGPQRQLLAANLERLRALPSDPGPRFVLVDTASARLWMFEDGRIVDTMRVIVGKRGQETPVMAGLIRFAVLNPYWNLPPDLAQQRARRVLREGVGVLGRERLQVLSDWGDSARVVSPSSVDWKAVAEGRVKLRMRQLPGGGNVMGDVKFMLPNRLGIYLHDTPDKSAFVRQDRRLSSGCVRVEDADRLARWLFQGRAPQAASAAAEQHVDLPEPVPVYITYLTAVPARDRVLFQADPERRDAALLERLAGRAESKGTSPQA